MNELSERLMAVRQRIESAAAQAGRKADSIGLLAVSKTRSAACLRVAYVAGQHAFGENYLDEALVKQHELADLAMEWHFIGPIQANKTRAISENFAWVHSVDRLKIARRLNDQRPQALAPLNCCVQVKLDDEANKSGVGLIELPALLKAVAQLPRLRLRGLMAMPAPRQGYQAQLASLQRFESLAQDLLQQGLLPTDYVLSMGMSKDLEAAVAAGTTLLRIGSDIFGPR